jgi:hypothetical protein
MSALLFLSRLAVLSSALSGPIYAPSIPSSEPRVPIFELSRPSAEPPSALSEDGPSPRVTTLQLAPGKRIRDALAIDVDGDGVCDLVLVESNDTEPVVRELSIHLQKRSGAPFSAAPDAVLTLTPDVVAYAVADVHPDPGAEIVLFSARAVFAWRWRAEESARFVKLLDCEFLWQMPDKKDAFHWQAGIVDLDGDGLPDLALPFADGWRLALQSRKDGVARFDRVFDLHVPEDSHAASMFSGAGRRRVVQPPGSRRNVSVSFEEGGFQMETEMVNGAPLVHVSESVPAAQFVDWDGDGDLDMMCMSTDRVYVFVQDPIGHFSDERRIDLKSPVLADRDRELDVSFSARVLDLDGDRRADCVIFAGDKRSKDVRTQALVFLQAPARDAARAPDGDPLFGAQGVPTQLLVLGGLARSLGCQDVDGDGLPDLLVGAIQPDLIDQLRAASTERIDADLYVYKNNGHGFEKHPQLTRKLSLPASNTAFSLDFVGDLDGDGMSEMLVREEKDRLRLYSTRRGRESWSVPDKPLWELAVDPNAELLLPASRTDLREVFVLGEKEILCVGLR